MTITPLITAEEGFPALERLVASAKSELLLSYRLFDPDTRLREPRLTERGLETWADLIAWVTRRGVKLRFLMTDFDPLFTIELHRMAWRNASGFADVVQGDAQVLVAPHGQRAGRLWHLLMAPKLLGILRELRAEDPTKLTPVQRRILERGVELRPVTVHQKFAIADGTSCIIGGLDIDERRFDTADHDRHPTQTWHDVSVVLRDEDFAGALRGHFAECWNAAIDAGAAVLADPPVRMDTSKRPQSRDDLRLLRTISTPRTGATRLGPSPHVRDHDVLVPKLFEEAQRYIYIETQFLRHAPLIDTLCDVSVGAPELEVIILLPAAPERVLFDGDDGWNARHAHGLQVRALDRLRRAFGHRLSIVTPAQPAPSPEDSPEVEGAGPVYVHSKVLVIDDRLALVGSANLNGRSLRWDSEASILVRNSDFARTLQRRLAEKWLGDGLGERDPRRAATWTGVAEANAAARPEDRTGFLVPYPLERSRQFARKMWILPNDMF